jgi:hypothetical protein
MLNTAVWLDGGDRMINGASMLHGLVAGGMVPVSGGIEARLANHEERKKTGDKEKEKKKKNEKNKKLNKNKKRKYAACG